MPPIKITIIITDPLPRRHSLTIKVAVHRIIRIFKIIQIIRIRNMKNGKNQNYKCWLNHWIANRVNINTNFPMTFVLRQNSKITIGSVTITAVEMTIRVDLEINVDGDTMTLNTDAISRRHGMQKRVSLMPLFREYVK